MIYLVTSDDGKIESYAALTRKNKADYAERHGYVSIAIQPGHVAYVDDLSPAWNLVAAVRHVLLNVASEGDWIFLSGADACIVDMDYQIEWLLGGYGDLLITRDANGINTNGILLRNCGWVQLLVERWWGFRGSSFAVRTNGHLHVWEEQSILMALLGEPGVDPESYAITHDGLFSVLTKAGDIQAMPDIPHHVRFLPQELTNGYYPSIYGPEYKEPVLVAHLPGKTTEERVKFIKETLGL